MFQGAVIAYYVIAGVSVTCSLLVSITLCKYGSLKTTATRLLLMVHLTLLSEEFTSLPYVYNRAPGLCTAIAFFHFYSGLANAVSVGLLVVSYRYHFFEEIADWVQFLFNHSIYLILGFPLITLLPFSTDSYTNSNEVWCTMQVDTQVTNIWAFVIFYAWAWSILLVSTIILIYTMCQVYSIDKEIGKNLFSTTGMYAIISILAWVPRTAARFTNFHRENMDNMAFLYAYIPVYIAGMLYTVVFLREKKSLLLFDRWSDWTTNDDNDLRVSFTFESSNQSKAYLEGLGSPRNPTGSPRASNRHSIDKRVKRAFYSPLLDRMVDEPDEQQPV